MPMTHPLGKRVYSLQLTYMCYASAINKPVGQHILLNDIQDSGTLQQQHSPAMTRRIPIQSQSPRTGTAVCVSNGMTTTHVILKRCFCCTSTTNPYSRQEAPLPLNCSLRAPTQGFQKMHASSFRLELLIPVMFLAPPNSGCPGLVPGSSINGMVGGFSGCNTCLIFFRRTSFFQSL